MALVPNIGVLREDTNIQSIAIPAPLHLIHQRLPIALYLSPGPATSEGFSWNMWLGLTLPSHSCLSGFLFLPQVVPRFLLLLSLLHSLPSMNAIVAITSGEVSRGNTHYGGGVPQGPGRAHRCSRGYHSLYVCEGHSHCGARLCECTDSKVR